MAKTLPYEWTITWTDSKREPKTVIADLYQQSNGFFHFAVWYSDAGGDSDVVLTVRESDVAMIEQGNPAARIARPRTSGR